MSASCHHSTAVGLRSPAPATRLPACPSAPVCARLHSSCTTTLLLAASGRLTHASLAAHQRTEPGGSDSDILAAGGEVVGAVSNQEPAF